MRMAPRSIAMAMALAFSNAALGEPSSGPSPTTSKHFEKIVGKRDGKFCATAYKARSVRDEYKIMASLGLEPFRQALVTGKKPCDVLTARDPATGNEYEVWFDISAFYPMF